MIEINASQLISKLSKFGLQFKSFSLSHHGDYASTDADWNYKDIPHLAIVHKLVDSAIASAGERSIATVNVQKILGLKFPLVVYNYHPANSPQTYFTTLFFYTLIIETNPKPISSNKCEVVTTYNIGSSRFWMLFFPVLKFLLKRNYKDLMSTDIPMRNRRGQLRSWGYEFKYDTEYCGFESTNDTSKKNLWPRKNLTSEFSSQEVKFSELKSLSEVLIGKSDHFGLRLKIFNDKVLVFPRLCPHEGANLDESSCSGKVVKCPWHARAFSAISEFSTQNEAKIELEHCTLQVTPTSVIWSPRNPS